MAYKRRRWKSRRTFRRAPWASWRVQNKRRKRYPLHMGARHGGVGDTKVLCVIPIRPNEVMLPSFFKYRFVSSDDYDAELLLAQRVVAMQLPASVFSNPQDGPYVGNELHHLEGDVGVDIAAGGGGSSSSDLSETIDDPGKVDLVAGKIIQGYNQDDPESDDSQTDPGTDSGLIFDQLWQQPLIKRRQLMRQMGIKVLKNTITPLAPVYNTSATKIRVGQEQTWKLSSPQGRGKFYTSNKLTYVVFCFTNFHLGTNFDFGAQDILHPAHLLPPKMADARYDLFGGYGGGDVGIYDASAKHTFRRLKSLYHRGDNLFDGSKTDSVAGVGSLIARPKIATDLPPFTP